jgi:hypothetical protein
MDPRLEGKLNKMYPSCTHREIVELASSIQAGKYWRAQEGLVFTIALTRARARRGPSWMAESTGLGRMMVPDELKPFCRKGRVALVRERELATAVLFLGWPAFLWAMRKGEVPRLVEGALEGRLKGYVGVPELKEYLRCRDEGLAGPSGIGPETPGSP